LTSIHQKKARGRCTACKRSERVAIAEQAARGEPCPLGGCEFAAEIAAAIENKSRITMVQKEKKKINITRKESRKIDFIKHK
jgi:Na+-translocating ferredoxin:NAD+ oxidoreductase RNF subunit RnfB